MEHEESLACWCCPSVEYVVRDDASLVAIVVHNSIDEAN